MAETIKYRLRAEVTQSGVDIIEHTVDDVPYRLGDNEEIDGRCQVFVGIADAMRTFPLHPRQMIPVNVYMEIIRN